MTRVEVIRQRLKVGDYQINECRTSSSSRALENGSPEPSASLDLQLQYSLSDRIRYYWPDRTIAAAKDKLFANLRETPPPLALVSQYLPIAFASYRAGRSRLDPDDLVIAHVNATLDAYYGACDPDV